jgi:3-methyl-2-oxobutanoate hydroxymethyltransferase
MRLTLNDINKKYAAGEKLVMLSCYDASFAALLDANGVELLLVGDSLGMVVQGHSNPLPVTIEDSVYHTAAVARGSKTAMVMGDLPFATYQISKEQGFANAAKLMQAGAGIIKLEGGALMAPTVEFLVTRGIPVCGHLGLTPQAFNQLGGFRMQGRDDAGAQQLVADAKALEDAGAAMVVLEFIPASVGKRVTEALKIPTIGIGAGPDCSGQILVLYDMLDIFPGQKPSFVKNYMAIGGSPAKAVAAFVREVKSGAFPTAEYYKP